MEIYLMLNEFIVTKNEYLHCDIQGFYRVDYTGYNKPNNPNYLNVLKNTFNSTFDNYLDAALNELQDNLVNELTYIYNSLNIKNETLYICVVPRSKALGTYDDNQLIFRNCFKHLLGVDFPLPSYVRIRGGGMRKYGIDYGTKRLPNFFGDGVDFIIRTTNTRTTHLSKSNLENDGDMPYVGITKNTCKLSPEIYNKHILLIDDIYTKTVNIDEDAIQALLDYRAKSVTLFTIAKTVELDFKDLI